MNRLSIEQLGVWIKEKAQWRLIGFIGEELVMSILEENGYTVVKQKPYFVEVNKGLVDLGSKVDLIAISPTSQVMLLEVKSTTRGWKPKLSKAQENLQAFCALAKIPYSVVSVSFEADRVEIENLKMEI